MDVIDRAELRQLFETHFARLDAAVERRFGALRGEFAGPRSDLRRGVAELRSAIRADCRAIILWDLFFKVSFLIALALLVRP